MNQLDLKTIFDQQSDRGSCKWNHYFEIYERFFEKYRGKEVHILEIGISGGGSLQIWKKYFGDKAHIYGVDISSECKKFEEDQIKIFIGDQSNKRFLRNLSNKIPKLDIVLDDGGHEIKQQINTFEILFPKIADNGIYMCEDTHSSYQLNYKGSYNAKNTFIDHMKKQIDYLHAWHTDDAKLKVNDFTRSSHCISFYDSIVVIEKGIIEKPYTLLAGKKWLPSSKEEISLFSRLIRKIKRVIGIID